MKPGFSEVEHELLQAALVGSALTAAKGVFLHICTYVCADDGTYGAVIAL